MKQKRIKAKRKKLEKIATKLIAKHLKKLTKKQDKVVLALSGGSSVLGIYKRLKKFKLKWKKIHIFVVDDRQVSIKSKDSNSRLIINTFVSYLIKKRRFPKENFHPFIYKRNWKINDYNEQIEKFKKFDLVILSAGEDGHIGSLFPNHPSIKDNSKYYIKVSQAPKEPRNRISASKHLISSAKTAFILFIGDSKKTALKKYYDHITPLNLLPAKLTYKIPLTYVLTDQKVKKP